MAAWIAAIFYLLKSAPEFLSLIMELKKLWDDHVDDDQRQLAVKKFGEAFKNARETKDTTQLTGLVNSILATGRVPDEPAKPN